VPLSNFAPRGFGFVHHSIAILYHEVPNPNITIRNFLIAVRDCESSRHVVPDAPAAVLRSPRALPGPRHCDAVLTEIAARDVSQCPAHASICVGGEPGASGLAAAEAVVQQLQAWQAGEPRHERIRGPHLAAGEIETEGERERDRDRGGGAAAAGVAGRGAAARAHPRAASGRR
jgi:hypothetical protein